MSLTDKQAQASQPVTPVNPAMNESDIKIAKETGGAQYANALKGGIAPPSIS